MTVLALIRHGPTAWNHEGRIQGRTDGPLAAAGRREVKSWIVPAELAGYAWLSSPLRRARETAKLLTGRDPPVEPRLTEMSWGAWEGCRLAELRAELGETMAAMEDLGIDFRPPGGESPRLVQARVRPLLVELAAGGRPTVAVTHRGVMRAIYAAATGWDMKAKPPQKLRGPCAQLFEIDVGGAPGVARLNVRLRPP